MGIRPLGDSTHGHHPRTVDGLTVRPASPWFVTENFPRTQSENLAKSRLTDRPTVQTTVRGQDFPYQPLTQTTVDQHGPSFNPRSVGLTVDERFQISSVTDGTHGHHTRTVDGLTVRPAGPWFVTENFPRTQSENLAKSRLTDRPTVRRSDHGPWSVSVDREFPYQPLRQTTVDQYGPSFDPRCVGLTVDEVSS
ncbi:hypothetical protein MTR67_022689 [Solanum verrucosum]|uniref:Uncharacterized protein n=1 Tax=Solanum verrucosum TaxID=315347 RepID=A0AAF0TRI4_SOLVR|nr:hypothetical protein MTR67_022689 [Solanum verrucosum]